MGPLRRIRSHDDPEVRTTTVYPLLLVVMGCNGMFAVLLDNVGHMSNCLTGLVN